MTNQAIVLPVSQQTMNIQTAGVKADESVLVEGELFFSALTQKTEEFTKHSNFKKLEYGVRIANPKILHTSGTDNGQNLARYLASQTYASTYEDQTTPALTLTTSGAKPRLFDRVVRSENGFEAEHELGRQTVVVEVGSFKSGQYSNVGVGLNMVLVEDQNNMKYFKGGGANIAGFSALGIEANPDAPTFTPAQPQEQQAVQAQQAQPQADPFAQAQAQQYQQPNQQFQNGQVQGYQQPQVDPFAQAQAQQFQQPNQQFQQQVQADPFQQPMQPQGDPFAQNAQNNPFQ